jgi:DNA polymerase theta
MSILRDKRILDRCRLVLTVHDECVFEVDAKSAKAIANIVRDGLESIASQFRLAVPLPVKVKLGPSLAEDALREVPRLSHSKPPSLAPTPATSPIKPTPR